MIKLMSKIVNDEYTDYVCSTFDIEKKPLTIKHIDISFIDELDDFKWNIGLLFGGSGSGKSSILNELGGETEIIFDNSKSLISNFDFVSPKDACLILSAMGLASVPTWLQPFSTLSNGEQYRARLAYVVSKAGDGDTILIDEYTSVVDRDVAKSMSYSLQKYIHRTNKKIILASCHYDIVEWLNPCWVYNVNNNGGTLERGECLRQSRPKIELQVVRATYDSWNLFKQHHYMSDKCNKAFTHLLFLLDGKPIAINVIGNHYGCGVKAFRGSRLVVLPEYQGIGIGSKISEFCGAICKSIGARYYTKTINPAIGMYRNSSQNWQPSIHNGRQRKRNKIGSRMLERVSYCHQYIGEPIYGFESLLNNIGSFK